MAEGSPAVRKPVYFEDLSVGQTFATGSHTMHEAEIKAFASKYDPQPFHLDNEAASHSFFGRLVASGWHTAAITMRLLVEGGFPIAGGVIGAGGSLKWLKPTYPGDTLSVRGEIIEITPPTEKRPDRGFALISAETVNQNGDVVQVMTANLIVPRRNSLSP